MFPRSFHFGFHFLGFTFNLLPLCWSLDDAPSSGLFQLCDRICQSQPGRKMLCCNSHGRVLQVKSSQNASGSTPPSSSLLAFIFAARQKCSRPSLSSSEIPSHFFALFWAPERRSSPWSYIPQRNGHGTSTNISCASACQSSHSCGNSCDLKEISSDISFVSSGFRRSIPAQCLTASSTQLRSKFP